MAYADCVSAIKVHCAAAGLAATPKIKVVRATGVVQTPEAQITVEYTGDGENTFAANSLSTRSIAEHLVIKVWWPVASFDKGAAEAVELAIRAIKADIVSRLDGDVTLGGNCMGLEVDNATVAWEQVTAGGLSGQVFRTLQIPVSVALADVDSFAP